MASLYLEAPLLVEVGLLSIGPSRLQLSGGLAPAALLSCHVSGTTLHGSVRARCGEDVTENGATYGPGVAYDLGWLIAPALRWPTRSGSLLAEIRHTRGVVDIRPDEGGRTRNHATALSVAMSWRMRSVPRAR